MGDRSADRRHSDPQRHCRSVWMTILSEHATFGTAILFVTPMAGAYAAVRLVLPIAPTGCCGASG